MSILDTEKKLYTKIDKIRKTAENGETYYEYVDGAKFFGWLVKNDSMPARIGMAQGVRNVYTMMTKKNIKLDYHDVFRRDADGKVFRSTGDGEDMETPIVAGLNLRKVSAEEWEIPS